MNDSYVRIYDVLTEHFKPFHFCAILVLVSSPIEE